MGLAHNDSEGIFRNLVVQALGGIFGSHHGTVVLAEGYALSATYAFGVVYFCLAAGIEVHSVVCAVLHADVAAYAAFYVNLGLRGAVQFQLSAYTGTSHAQILQGAAKTGLFVPLEVVHTDYNIGIGYRCADFGCRTIFPVQRDFAVVRSLQSVADNDLALGRDRVKAILHRTLQVVYSIGTTTGIQRVAVRQERFGSQAAEQGCHSSCIIGTQVCQVSGFAEMDFNGSKAIFQRKLLDACPFQQAFHFIQKIGCRGGTQIRVVYFCFFHVFYLFIVIVSAKITDYFHINRYMAKKSREIPFDK